MRSLIPNQGVQSIHLKRETEKFVSNSFAVSLSGEAKRPSFLELHCFREICFSIKLSTTFLAQARALPMTGDKNRFFSVRRPSLAPRHAGLAFGWLVLPFLLWLTADCRVGFSMARVLAAGLLLPHSHVRVPSFSLSSFTTRVSSCHQFYFVLLLVVSFFLSTYAVEAIFWVIS